MLHCIFDTALRCTVTGLHWLCTVLCGAVFAILYCTALHSNCIKSCTSGRALQSLRSASVRLALRLAIPCSALNTPMLRSASNMPPSRGGTRGRQRSLCSSLTAAHEGVRRLGSKGAGRHVNNLSVVSCKVMQNCVECWEAAFVVLLVQLIERDR